MPGRKINSASAARNSSVRCARAHAERRCARVGRASAEVAKPPSARVAVPTLVIIISERSQDHYEGDAGGDGVAHRVLRGKHDWIVVHAPALCDKPQMDDPEREERKSGR